MNKFFSLLIPVILISCAREPQVPPTYTLKVETGTKATMALGLDESGALKATWAEGEKVKVSKGTDLIGTLTAQSSGKSTTLSGTVTGDIKVGTKLYLDFPDSDYDYSSQDGTLTGYAGSIDRVCDYATAAVKVTSIDGGTVTTEKAVFKNMQAIVRLMLKHGEADLPAELMSVTVSGYTSPGPSSITISVNPVTPSNELYVAIPCYYNEEDEPLSLSFLVSSSGAPYARNDVSKNLKNGGFYSATLTLY